MGYSGFEWGDYVSVAERRQRAARELAKLKKRDRSVAPVIIEGRNIAKNFWGKSWCANLERYSDFASRLPRGRRYVCNGLVVDLQIAKGKIAARVSGSELYDVAITIAPVAAKRWRAICRDCSGTIDSLVELLAGRLAKGVMDRVCREGDGLFPAPDEIKLSCSCPDWADMCKHVAATLYGVGARLDERPQLLFVLRGVDEGELLSGAGANLIQSQPLPAAGKVLADDDVAALFGLELADGAVSAVPRKSSRSAKTTKQRMTSVPAETPARLNDAQPGRKRGGIGSTRSAEAPTDGRLASGRAKRTVRRSAR
jgi:uncharacterized Zn finger protein